MKKKCFVIMPFSKTTDKHTEAYWTNHYEIFLKPIIENNTDFEVYRSPVLSGDIIKGIITSLVTDHLVVADLTDDNPNVFWELGIRQSFQHGTITIKDETFKNSIPFDLSTYGTVFYNKDSQDGIKEFTSQFMVAINEYLSNDDNQIRPKRPDSHVLETITGRGSIYFLIHKEEIYRKLHALSFELRNNIQLCQIIEKFISFGEEEKIEKYGNNVISCQFSCKCMELLLTTGYLTPTTILEPNLLEKIRVESKSTKVLLIYDFLSYIYSDTISMNLELKDWTSLRRQKVEEFLRRQIPIYKDLLADLNGKLTEEINNIQKLWA